MLDNPLEDKCGVVVKACAKQNLYDKYVFNLIVKNKRGDMV
jgi:hypothetical protein